MSSVCEFVRSLTEYARSAMLKNSVVFLCTSFDDISDSARSVKKYLDVCCTHVHAAGGQYMYNNMN